MAIGEILTKPLEWFNTILNSSGSTIIYVGAIIMALIFTHIILRIFGGVHIPGGSDGTRLKESDGLNHGAYEADKIYMRLSDKNMRRIQHYYKPRRSK